jgi:hypothetical protein
MGPLRFPSPYPVSPLSLLPPLAAALCPPPTTPPALAFSQVCRTLQEKGASTVPLSAMDVAQVLDSLVYEGWLDYEGAGAWRVYARPQLARRRFLVALARVVLAPDLNLSPLQCRLRLAPPTPSLPVHSSVIVCLSP